MVKFKTGDEVEVIEPYGHHMRMGARAVVMSPAVKTDRSGCWLNVHWLEPVGVCDGGYAIRRFKHIGGPW